jgi:predicted dithiol-disulfide oxidoreductase (DUF899 family)
MTDEIKALERQIDEMNEQLFKLRAEAPAEKVDDHAFQTESGPVKLSDLFGDKKELIIIHNMGRSCDYCTMWADGFESMRLHLESRAAFVLVSPDSPERQAEVRKERGWTYRMVQDDSRAFTQAMGYWNEKDGWWPGTSVFAKGEDGTITRTGKAFFGPGDAFCPAWQFFSMLPGGAGDWEPK